MSLKIALERIAKAVETNARELDLSGLGLTSIPKEIQQLKNLEILYLSSNQISKIENLEGLPLQILDLSSNQISKIENLTELPLIKLNLGSNQISKIENLKDLPLKDLDLGSNRITKIENLEGLLLKDLDLGNNQISKIENLAGLPLQILSLENNQISKIENLEGLPLQKLKLRSNKISKIENLAGLPLQILNLNSNKISKIENLAGLSLQRLDLWSNKISKIENLAGLPLQRLNLNNNQISKLENLAGLPLQELNLSNNQISKIENLSELPLQELDLSNNQISKIENLLGLPLQTLNLSNNQISKIENLSGLSLQRLDLWSNKISKIENLEELDLKELNLSNNQISKIENLEELDLKELDLSNNQISKIENLARLSLKKLNLGSNKISKIENLIGLPLQELNLEDNQISKIENLEGLFLIDFNIDILEIIKSESEFHDKINILNLSKNQINKIESLQGNFINFLDISDNYIKKIENLEGLPLVALFLNNNYLTRIENVKLPSLLGLSLKNNSISKIENIIDLPLHFTNLSNNKIKYINHLLILLEQNHNIYLNESFLRKEGRRNIEHKSILIGNNPIEDCPIEVIKQGREAVIDYLKKPKKKLLEARVLVLGEPRAGKTTLRRKLKALDGEMPTAAESTKAFDIEIDPYSCKLVVGQEEQTIKYNLWDFGGQDYYRLLHQLFVAEEALYIIVADTDRNKNEEEVEFWLETIERLGKNKDGEYSPVIVLQNAKTQREGKDFPDLKSRYPFWKQSELFTINLNALDKKKESYNAEEVEKFKRFKVYLTKSFNQLNHIGRELPVEWVKVKKELSKRIKDNWISIEEFDRICRKCNLHYAEERATLLAVLHSLGYIQHYKNTTLQGMVILNPKWTTDALYRVLDDKLIEKNQGWFCKTDAATIWHEAVYQNRNYELLELMLVFKLSYWNTNSQKYIVPTRLPEIIADAPVWDKANNVRLHLCYDWMPKAIPLQLIVSLHHYLIDLDNGKQWIWKSGAVLDGKQLCLENTQVQIINNWREHKIEIAARGEQSEILIRQVMMHWEQVHEPFKEKVNVEKLILCGCEKCKLLKNPMDFDYYDVLDALNAKEELQCNKSRTLFKAADILKGLFDGVQQQADALMYKKGNSAVLEYISKNRIDKALDALPNTKTVALLKREYNSLSLENIQGLKTAEEYRVGISSLSKRLLDYLEKEDLFDRYSKRRKYEEEDEEEPIIEENRSPIVIEKLSTEAQEQSSYKQIQEVLESQSQANLKVLKEHFQSLAAPKSDLEKITIGQHLSNWFGSIGESRLNHLESSVYYDAIIQLLAIDIQGKQLAPIIFSAANPDDTATLRLNRELSAIKNEFEGKQEFLYQDITDSQWSKLVAALGRKASEVLHFCGHGSSKALLFHDTHNQAIEIDITAIESLLKANPSIKLVVLNSCHSAALAEQIAQKGVTAIGTTDDLPDNIGAQFSAAFYAYYANNRGITASFDAGEAAIMGGNPAFKGLYKLYEPVNYFF